VELVDWDTEDEDFIPDSADQAVQEALGSSSAPLPLGSAVAVEVGFKKGVNAKAIRDVGSSHDPPSSAAAVRESRPSTPASDGGPPQLATVVLLKRPPSGTTEATAAKLKSEIHVPSLAARELRASFRDEPQQLPEGSDEGWQTVQRRHARRAEAKKASRESLLQQARRPPFLEKQSDARHARYL
jgi:hypothetical protein